ncbi:MAG: HAMP domain-containing protein [Herpetosiphonaceae bacterium]|nr:HAMP domain-containing protein [Herpetosiphonaceae bacterium]
MAIRLRLAYWYGAFLGLILLIAGTLTYALHTRGHYDELDRTLITTAGHHATEAAETPAGLHLAVDDTAGFAIALRLYDMQGRLLEETSQSHVLPALDPQAILTDPAGPAYGRLASLAPALGPAVVAPAAGAFDILQHAGQRWRIYVLPIQQHGGTVGMIVAFTSLDPLDHAIQRFQTILLALGLISLILAAVGSWAIAGNALRPVADMIATARRIAHLRDFSHRVAASDSKDELSQLAATFNEMLESLEIAYRSQQRFVADASHELRAPLTAIQGNLELLRRRPNLSDADREEAIGEAEREARRLSRLVADLLALARADAGVGLQHRPVELDSIVLEAFSTARQLARGQSLALDPFGPATLVGDSDRLKQLVLILLDNALSYTPADGQVRLGLAETAGGVTITVADTGIGISAADLPHVYERFYRADPARTREPGGTGLGLAIARWIADQHEGAISIASQPGQGTTVTVTFPHPESNSYESDAP